MDTNASKQPLSEKLPSVSDDRPRSYTPYIKYTKLVFKVKLYLHFLYLLDFSFLFLLLLKCSSDGHLHAFSACLTVYVLKLDVYLHFIQFMF